MKEDVVEFGCCCSFSSVDDDEQIVACPKILPFHLKLDEDLKPTTTGDDEVEDVVSVCCCC